MPYAVYMAVVIITSDEAEQIQAHCPQVGYPYWRLERKQGPKKKGTLTMIPSLAAKLGAPASFSVMQLRHCHVAGSKQALQHFGPRGHQIWHRRLACRTICPI